MSRRLLSLCLLAVVAVAALTGLVSCASNDLSNQVLQAHVGISGTSPASGAMNVSVDAPGGVAFLDTVEPREAAVMSFTLADAAGNNVPGTVEFVPTAALFTPLAPLTPNTAYRYSITTGVRMTRGQLERDVYEWNFTTGNAPEAAR